MSSLQGSAPVWLRLQSPDGSSGCFPLYPQKPFYLSAAKKACGSWQENNQQVFLSARDIRDTGMFKLHSHSQPLSAQMELCGPLKSPNCFLMLHSVQGNDHCLAQIPWELPHLTPWAHACFFCQLSWMSDKGCWKERGLWHPWGPSWLVSGRVVLPTSPSPPLNWHQGCHITTTSCLVIMQETCNLFLKKGWVPLKMRDWGKAYN